MPVIAPTKGNLSKIKRSLALAKMGYELMDRKRNILIREMMLLIDRAADIQSKIDTCYAEAYQARFAGGQYQAGRLPGYRPGHPGG